MLFVYGSTSSMTFYRRSRSRSLVDVVAAVAVAVYIHICISIYIYIYIYIGVYNVIKFRQSHVRCRKYFATLSDICYL
jgi:hypothetical protein